MYSGLQGGHYSLSQLTLIERQGNTWTSYQVITWLADRDKQKLTFTPSSNVESPISRPCMSLDCAGKQQYPEGTHTGTVRTTPHQKKASNLGIQPRTFLPCCPLEKQCLLKCNTKDEASIGKLPQTGDYESLLSLDENTARSARPN